ncbi:MAG: FAD-binding domain-containing protein [Pseudomonadota bacterium]
MRESHPATRTEALSRLTAFVPNAGRDYASKRNYDLPGHPHVSVLSPYIRHRLITEEEVLATVLGRYSLSTAEKFIQEVFWRTYWKGWLELRPGVWTAYRRGVHAGLDRIATEGGMRKTWEAACRGDTGIVAFDHWARELVDTGYLHNHARMWFASIWIFTLELPWELGADFFLRHLLDGDPAANTLSWRWVAGLQTRGKHYIARASNIAKYTEGRFNPGYQLNTQAEPLDGPVPPERRAPPVSAPVPTGARIGIIVTEDDLSLNHMLTRPAAATLFVSGAASRSPLEVSPRVLDFTQSAMADTAARYADQLGPVTGPVAAAEIDTVFDDWVSNNALDGVVMPFAPVGPARDALWPLIKAGKIAPIVRSYDEASWPHAKAGFFKFKSQIPDILSEIGIPKAA